MDVAMMEKGGNWKNPAMFLDEGYYWGRYNYFQINELTHHCKPYLLTSEADIGGKERGKFGIVKTVSTVGVGDCAGHFGSRESGQENLRIPLLHLSRIMKIAGQIAALHGLSSNGNGHKIPVLVGGKKVRARNQNLMAPPASVVALATDFEYGKDKFSAKTFARAEGEEYAEIERLFFQFLPIADFSNRKRGIVSEIPEAQLKSADWQVVKDMYRYDIERNIFERQPFHQLDRAILYISDAGLKLVTRANITEAECDGELKINGQSTISLIDYSKLMALTAELLASLVTQQRFDGLKVVPIAVKVENVTTPHLFLLSPPASVVVEANISFANLNDVKKIRRGKNQFWADTASVLVEGVEVAKMEKIAYALIQKDLFF